jgi:hypothetical protein
MSNKLFKSTLLPHEFGESHVDKNQMEIIEEENDKQLLKSDMKFMRSDIIGSLVEDINENHRKNSISIKDMITDIDRKYIDDEIKSKDIRIKELEEMVARLSKQNGDQNQKISNLEVKLEAAEKKIADLTPPNINI